MRSSVQFLLALCLVAGIAACQPSKPGFNGTDLSTVDWGRDIALDAHTGQRVSTADFRGKTVVLFFGYTHCPDICAPTLAKLAAVRKSLGRDGERMQVFFVTVDPVHDTPQQLASFVPKIDPSFIGLTGKPDEIAAAAREYKVAYAPTPVTQAQQILIDHSGAVFVKDAKGKLRLFWKNELSVPDMEHDMRLLLKES